MKKKVLAMVLAAAMTASMLAGCSGSGSDKAEDTAAADTEETTSDSAEQTDAPAEGEEKTIGFVAHRHGGCHADEGCIYEKNRGVREEHQGGFPGCLR